jgi:hypothetical protein
VQRWELCAFNNLCRDKYLPEGVPHLTLISTLQANLPQELIWGQITEGLSTQFVTSNPRTGFLILTLDKNLWRGKANWTRRATSGPEYDMYNRTPMFRYNAYFGIHTVHYFATSAYRGELEAIPANATVALFGMSLDMEDVLRRGLFQGIRRVGGVRCGVVQVNWVYNAMPPVPGQIYPKQDIAPVKSF